MTELTPAEVTLFTRRGLRLAQFTVGYNVLEGILSIAAGVAAGLVSVIGFGFDSAIESAVAILVGLRLAARLRNGEADERREKRGKGAHTDVGQHDVRDRRIVQQIIRARGALQPRAEHKHSHVGSSSNFQRRGVYG